MEFEILSKGDIIVDVTFKQDLQFEIDMILIKKSNSQIVKIHISYDICENTVGDGIAQKIIQQNVRTQIQDEMPSFMQGILSMKTKNCNFQKESESYLFQCNQIYEFGSSHFNISSIQLQLKKTSAEIITSNAQLKVKNSFEQIIALTASPSQTKKSLIFFNKQLPFSVAYSFLDKQNKILIRSRICDFLTFQSGKISSDSNSEISIDCIPYHSQKSTKVKIKLPLGNSIEIFKSPQITIEEMFLEQTTKYKCHYKKKDWHHFKSSEKFHKQEWTNLVGKINISENKFDFKSQYQIGSKITIEISPQNLGFKEIFYLFGLQNVVGIIHNSLKAQSVDIIYLALSGSVSPNKLIHLEELTMWSKLKFKESLLNMKDESCNLKILIDMNSKQVINWKVIFNNKNMDVLELLQKYQISFSPIVKKKYAVDRLEAEIQNELNFIKFFQNCNFLLKELKDQDTQQLDQEYNQETEVVDKVNINKYFIFSFTLQLEVPIVIGSQQLICKMIDAEIHKDEFRTNSLFKASAHLNNHECSLTFGFKSETKKWNFELFCEEIDFNTFIQGFVDKESHEQALENMREIQDKTTCLKELKLLNSKLQIECEEFNHVNNFEISGKWQFKFILPLFQWAISGIAEYSLIYESQYGLELNLSAKNLNIEDFSCNFQFKSNKEYFHIELNEITFNKKNHQIIKIEEDDNKFIYSLLKKGVLKSISLKKMKDGQWFASLTLIYDSKAITLKYNNEKGENGKLLKLFEFSLDYDSQSRIKAIEKEIGQSQVTNCFSGKLSCTYFQENYLLIEGQVHGNNQQLFTLLDFPVHIKGSQLMFFSLSKLYKGSIEELKVKVQNEEFNIIQFKEQFKKNKKILCLNIQLKIGDIIFEGLSQNMLVKDKYLQLSAQLDKSQSLEGFTSGLVGKQDDEEITKFVSYLKNLFNLTKINLEIDQMKNLMRISIISSQPQLDLVIYNSDSKKRGYLVNLNLSQILIQNEKSTQDQIQQFPFNLQGLEGCIDGYYATQKSTLHSFNKGFNISLTINLGENQITKPFFQFLKSLNQNFNQKIKLMWNKQTNNLEFNFEGNLEMSILKLIYLKVTSISISKEKNVCLNAQLQIPALMNLTLCCVIQKDGEKIIGQIAMQTDPIYILPGLKLTYAGGKIQFSPNISFKGFVIEGLIKNYEDKGQISLTIKDSKCFRLLLPSDFSLCPSKMFLIFFDVQFNEFFDSIIKFNPLSHKGKNQIELSFFGLKDISIHCQFEILRFLKCDLQLQVSSQGVYAMVEIPEKLTLIENFLEISSLQNEEKGPKIEFKLKPSEEQKFLFEIDANCLIFGQKVKVRSKINQKEGLIFIFEISLDLPALRVQNDFQLLLNSNQWLLKNTFQFKLNLSLPSFSIFGFSIPAIDLNRVEFESELTLDLGSQNLLFMISGKLQISIFSHSYMLDFTKDKALKVEICNFQEIPSKLVIELQKYIPSSMNDLCPKMKQQICDSYQRLKKIVGDKIGRVAIFFKDIFSSFFKKEFGSEEERMEAYYQEALRLFKEKEYLKAFYFFIKIDKNFQDYQVDDAVTVHINQILKSCDENWEIMPEMVFTYLIVANDTLLQKEDNTNLKCRQIVRSLLALMYSQKREFLLEDMTSEQRKKKIRELLAEDQVNGKNQIIEPLVLQLEFFNSSNLNESIKEDLEGVHIREVLKILTKYNAHPNDNINYVYLKELQKNHIDNYIKCGLTPNLHKKAAKTFLGCLVNYLEKTQANDNIRIKILEFSVAFGSLENIVELEDLKLNSTDYKEQQSAQQNKFMSLSDIIKADLKNDYDLSKISSLQLIESILQIRNQNCSIFKYNEFKDVVEMEQSRLDLKTGIFYRKWKLDEFALLEFKKVEELGDDVIYSKQRFPFLSDLRMKINLKSFQRIQNYYQAQIKLEQCYKQNEHPNSASSFYCKECYLEVKDHLNNIVHKYRTKPTIIEFLYEFKSISNINSENLANRTLQLKPLIPENNFYQDEKIKMFEIDYNNLQFIRNNARNDRKVKNFFEKFADTLMKLRREIGILKQIQKIMKIKDLEKYLGLKLKLLDFLNNEIQLRRFFLAECNLQLETRKIYKILNKLKEPESQYFLECSKRHITSKLELQSQKINSSNELLETFGYLIKQFMSIIKKIFKMTFILFL